MTEKAIARTAGAEWRRDRLSVENFPSVSSVKTVVTSSGVLREFKTTSSGARILPYSFAKAVTAPTSLKSPRNGHSDGKKRP